MLDQFSPNTTQWLLEPHRWECARFQLRSQYLLIPPMGNAGGGTELALASFRYLC